MGDNMTDYDSAFIELIAKSIQVIKNQSLAKMTTFNVGGNAKLFCKPVTNLQLIKTIRICDKYKIKRYILGRGSNTLFSDDGYDGMVILLKEGFDKVIVNPDGMVTAGAGASLMKVSKLCAEKHLTGFEFAYGIPGSIGGALYMNAGAYGGQMKDVVIKAECITPECEDKEITEDEMLLGYRTSCFKNTKDNITKVHLQLQNGCKADILNTTMRKQRIDKQPVNMASAGSTFKRPEGAYAAALIEECGLKGKCVGGAMVSDKHSGFIVNTGKATCADILDLIEIVKNTVKEKTGFVLETEIEVVE